MEKIGIIGCGWLGFPLAQHFIQKNYSVNGTSTSESKSLLFTEHHIQHFTFHLGTPIEATFFEDLDYIVLSLPVSSKNAFSDYAELVAQIQRDKAHKSRIVFTSSTSVYNQFEGVIDEETKEAINHQSINFRFENILQRSFKDQLTILRLGGLIGEDRHPIIHLSGRVDLKNGHDPINLIHRADVIQSIYAIIDQNAFGKVYNCVYPFHPRKQEYYTSEAHKRNLQAPVYIENGGSGKIIDGSKITRELGIVYLSLV